MIYFIQAETTNLVKIGYTSDIRCRLADLQAASPFPLTVMSTMPGDISDEHRLHARFKRLRVHNEWFQLSNELLDLIRSGNTSLSNLLDVSGCMKANYNILVRVTAQSNFWHFESTHPRVCRSSKRTTMWNRQRLLLSAIRGAISYYARFCNADTIRFDVDDKVISAALEYNRFVDWRTNGWKYKNGNRVGNSDLWEAIILEQERTGVRITSEQQQELVA